VTPAEELQRKRWTVQSANNQHKASIKHTHTLEAEVITAIIEDSCCMSDERNIASYYHNARAELSDWDRSSQSSPTP
jgi:hypothetical protein